MKTEPLSATGKSVEAAAGWATLETTPPEKPTVAKAVMAGVTALAGALLTALADNGITATEWVFVGSTTVIAVAAVWATTNRPT